MTYVLRVLPIKATVSQGSCPGLSALRGQGLHPTLHHGVHGSEPGSHSVFKRMLSRSPDKMRAQGEPQLFWPSTQWGHRTGNGIPSRYEMTYTVPLRPPLARKAEAPMALPSTSITVGCFGVVA